MAVQVVAVVMRMQVLVCLGQVMVAVSMPFARQQKDGQRQQDRGGDLLQAERFAQKDDG